MNWSHKERWLAVVITGYVAWVIPYVIRQYTSFLKQIYPEVHTLVSLAAILLICAILTIALFRIENKNPLTLGLFVAIPWVLICLFCDFGLDTYYRGWVPDISAYGLSRVWHFVFVPVGSIIAGLVALFYWKSNVKSDAPVVVVRRVSK